MKKENKRLQFAQKIGMTILLLLLIRFMSHIPVPGVKHSMFKLAVAGKGNGYFQLYDRLTGGSFSNMTILWCWYYALYHSKYCCSVTWIYV